MPQDAPWSSLSTTFWLLTAGSEVRRVPPPSVRLGAAATALCDLADLGEVQWNGAGDKASVLVRDACRCPDETPRRWHEAMAESAAGSALPVRFSLDPLVRDAWNDIARRLVAEGAAVEVSSRLRLSRWSRFGVRDSRAVRSRRDRLERSVREDDLDPFQHSLVGAAWAAGAFDDLFRIHGIAVGGDLTERVRRRLDGDLLTGRLAAALAYSHSTPSGGLP